MDAVSAQMLDQDNVGLSMVKNNLAALGLKGCKDVYVGNAMIRGVSGGQKRRVTVGEMLVCPRPVWPSDDYFIPNLSLHFTTGEDDGLYIEWTRHFYGLRYHSSNPSRKQNPRHHLSHLAFAGAKHFIAIIKLAALFNFFYRLTPSCISSPLRMYLIYSMKSSCFTKDTSFITVISDLLFLSVLLMRSCFSFY